MRTLDPTDTFVHRHLGSSEDDVTAMLGTLGTDEEWISRHLSPDTVFTDLSPKRAKIDIQGPRSKAIIETILGHALPELGYFKFIDTEILGVPMTLSRTGYTGEWGYEMYFTADEAERMWNTFTESGEIKPAGLGARVALVERDLLGGDCLNVGCVPSKALIRSSRVCAQVRAAGSFGVEVPEGVQVDFQAVMQRMHRLRSQIGVGNRSGSGSLPRRQI